MFYRKYVIIQKEMAVSVLSLGVSGHSAPPKDSTPHGPTPRRLVFAVINILHDTQPPQMIYGKRHSTPIPKPPSSKKEEMNAHGGSSCQRKPVLHGAHIPIHHDTNLCTHNCRSIDYGKHMDIHVHSSSPLSFLIQSSGYRLHVYAVIA